MLTFARKAARAEASLWGECEGRQRTGVLLTCSEAHELSQQPLGSTTTVACMARLHLVRVWQMI